MMLMIPMVLSSTTAEVTEEPQNPTLTFYSLMLICEQA